jgi:hypothetical protein
MGDGRSNTAILFSTISAYVLVFLWNRVSGRLVDTSAVIRIVPADDLTGVTYPLQEEVWRQIQFE